MALATFCGEDSANRSTPNDRLKNRSLVESNNRLRIATRIHFAMLRTFGDTVDVSDILQRPAQTREVLWVCEASGDEELMALAKLFREASARAAAPTVTTVVAMPPLTPAAQPAAPAAAPQDVAWARDTSGFGVSRPPEVPGGSGHPAPRRAGWLQSLPWLRGPRAPR